MEARVFQFNCLRKKESHLVQVVTYKPNDQIFAVYCNGENLAMVDRDYSRKPADFEFDHVHQLELTSENPEQVTATLQLIIHDDVDIKSIPTTVQWYSVQFLFECPWSCKEIIAHVWGRCRYVYCNGELAVPKRMQNKLGKSTPIHRHLVDTITEIPNHISQKRKLELVGDLLTVN